MEDDDTKNNHSNTPHDLESPSSVKGQRRQAKNNPRSRNDGTDTQKKKSFKRSWRKSGPVARWTLVFVGLTAIAGIGYLLVYFGVSVVQHFQSERQFNTEHRPRIEFARPPALIGTYSCDVKTRDISSSSGKIHTWVKNVRTSSDAASVFVAGPYLKLVADPPTGNPYLDLIPPITNDSCRKIVPPTMKMFPLNGGRQMMIETKEGFGNITYISKFEPFAIPFSQSKRGVDSVPTGIISNQTRFQLYATSCVYYSWEDDVKYGTCATYRLKTPRETYTFACQDSPISGEFERTLGGSCEN